MEDMDRGNFSAEILIPQESSLSGTVHDGPNIVCVGPVPPSPTTGQPVLNSPPPYPAIDSIEISSVVSLEGEDSDQTLSDFQISDPTVHHTFDCPMEHLRFSRKLIEECIQQFESSLSDHQTKISILEAELEQKESTYSHNERKYIEDNEQLSQQLSAEREEHRLAMETVGRLKNTQEQEEKLVGQLLCDQVTLQVQHDTLCEDKHALTMSMEEMAQNIHTSSSELEDLTEKNRIMTESNANLREEQDNLKNQLTEFKELNKKELEKKNEEINSLTEANSFLTYKLDRAELSCEESESEKRDISGKLNRSAEECENQTEQLTKARTEVEQLKREKSDLVKAKNNFDEQLRKEQTKSNKTSQELSAKKEEIANLREFQSKQAKELAAREGDIETLKRECTGLQNELSHFHAEKEQLKKEKEDLTKKYQSLDASSKNKTKTLEERENELTKLKKSHTTDVNSNKEKIANLTSTIEDLTRDKIKLKDERDASRQECCELMNQLNVLRAELQQCQINAELISAEKDKITEDNTQLEDLSTQTMKQLEEREIEINHLKQSHSDVVRQMQDAMSRAVEQWGGEKQEILDLLSKSKDKFFELSRQLQYHNKINAENSTLEYDREDLKEKFQDSQLEINTRKIVEAHGVEIALLKLSHSNQIGSMEKAMEDMANAIDTLKIEKQGLEEENLSWKQECERLNLILQDFEQIKSENSRLNQEREELIGILKGLQTSVDKLGGELEERRGEMNRLRVSHSEEILSLENRIESLNEDKSRTLSELTTTQQLYQELQTRWSEKCCEVEELNSEISNLGNVKNKLVEQLQAKLIVFQSENLNLGAENKENNHKITHLTNQLQEYSKDQILLKEKIVQYEEQLNEYSSKLHLNLELLSKVEDTFLGVSGYPPPDLCPGSAERVEWLVASLTSWNAELNSRISDQESSLHEKESDKLQMEIEMEELRHHYTAEDTKNDQLMQDNADLERRVQTLMSEKEELERKNVELENRLSETLEALNDSNARLNEAMQFKFTQNEVLNSPSHFSFEPHSPSSPYALSQEHRLSLQKAANEVSQLKVKLWRLEDEGNKHLEFLRKRVEELEVSIERHKLSIEVKEVAYKELYEECREWERKYKRCGQMQHELERMKRQLLKKEAETHERKELEVVLQKDNLEFRAHLEDCLRYIEELTALETSISTESPHNRSHSTDRVGSSSQPIVEPCSSPSSKRSPIFYPPDLSPK